MSQLPKVISKSTSVLSALETMKRLHIRHLPVLQGGRVIGVVSERDLRDRRIPARSKVDRVMIKKPYLVKKGEGLAVVAHKMARKRYGCAVVEDTSGKIVGIFTTTDALFLLSQVLGSNDFSRARLDKINWENFPEYMI